MVDIISKDGRYKRILNGLYPDQKVINLFQNNKSLYQEIFKYAKERDLSIKEYIISLGFEYIRKNEVVLYSEDEAIAELKYFYPNRVITNLTDVKNDHSNLYSNIKKFAKKKNISTYEYLFSLGYALKTETVGQSNIIYDSLSLLKLKEEYNFNGSNLARWLGVSKQNLDQKIARKRDLFPYWQKKELKEDELRIIDTMIENKLTCYENFDDKRIINIYRSNIVAVRAV